jgi:hypothetical protein
MFTERFLVESHPGIASVPAHSFYPSRSFTRLEDVSRSAPGTVQPCEYVRWSRAPFAGEHERLARYHDSDEPYAVGRALCDLNSECKSELDLRESAPPFDSASKDFTVTNHQFQRWEPADQLEQCFQHFVKAFVFALAVGSRSRFTLLRRTS